MNYEKRHVKYGGSSNLRFFWRKKTDLILKNYS
jgi:hypothetical protein